MYIKIIEISRYALPIMLGLAFALQFLTYILCTSYKKKAANIHNTNKELFRSIKLRYTNSAKLNIPLADTTSFVEKYFYGKGGPFRLAQGLDRFSGYMLCASLIATTALYVRSYSSITRMTAFMSMAICFYIFRAALSNDKQMQLAISYTTDYLDNTLKHRLSPEPLRNTRSNTEASNDNVCSSNVTAIRDNTVDNTGDNTTKTSSKNSIKNSSETYIEENSDIIDAVLQEFLA